MSSVPRPPPRSTLFPYTTLFRSPAGQWLSAGARRLSAGLLGECPLLPARRPDVSRPVRQGPPTFGARPVRLDELAERQQIALAVTEPGGLLVPEIGDAIDGFESGKVVFLEVDATAPELRDGGGDVLHEPGQLRVLSRGPPAGREEQEPTVAAALIEEGAFDFPGRRQAQLLLVERFGAGEILDGKGRFRVGPPERVHRTILRPASIVT